MSICNDNVYINDINLGLEYLMQINLILWRKCGIITNGTINFGEMLVMTAEQRKCENSNFPSITVPIKINDKFLTADDLCKDKINQIEWNDYNSINNNNNTPLSCDDIKETLCAHQSMNKSNEL